MSRERFGLAAMVVVLVAASCGRAGGSRGDVPSPSAPPQVRTMWVAIFDVASDPNELDADAQELMDVVGQAILVSPGGCLGGLPLRVAAPGDYVLGVRADSQGELEEIVETTGRTPLISVQVQDLCPI
jgi:hypothetical protein